MTRNDITTFGAVTLRRVVVTGVGAVTSIATNAKDTWDGIVAGRSGIKSIDLDPETNPCRVRGDVDESQVTNRFLEPKVVRNTSRFARMAVEAAGEALIDAGLVSETGDPLVDLSDAGTVVGTCVGGAHDDLLPAYDVFTAKGPSRVPPHLHVMFPLNLASYTIQWRWGMQGPSNTINTACATGSQAIGEAFHQIRYGKAPVMVAGATEMTSHPMFVAGFAVMKALATDKNDDPTAASRPFDKSRAGFVLGEGAGMVVLEEYEYAKARGARIYAEVLGFASTNDAYHPIAPRPDGSAAAKAIRNALKDAGVSADDVGHVQAHAASTPSGDPAEANAIKDVYGERASTIPVTSIKGSIGHTMGAAGAIESVVAVLSMYNQIIPPTLNYNTPDEDIGLNIVGNHAQKADFAISTKHSFGLGGQNACLVLGRVDA